MQQCSRYDARCTQACAPMCEDPPTLTLLPAARPACAQLAGCWSAVRLADAQAWADLQARLAACAAWPDLAWDVRGVSRLDHVGAQLLWNHWGRTWPAQLHALPAQQATLARVARWTQSPAPLPALDWRTLWGQLSADVWKVLDHAVDALALLGQLALDATALLRHPRRGPWRDVASHLYRMGTMALPVTALVGFMIGVVLAYLMSRQLRLFGADTFIVNILGVALVRELGPMLAAILVAGRSGSSITAQIGVMRVTEELDAMRVMGISPGARLVLPRVLALVLAMPLLAAWTTLAAMLGGMLAADAVLGVNPSYFAAKLPSVISQANMALALGKSALFGLLIAFIGCHFGLRVKPDTDSLGRGTTNSVVASITLVLLADAWIAVLSKNVGL
ncbi:MAG: ABC transporter permease [Rhodoferax sp.]